MLQITKYGFFTTEIVFTTPENALRTVSQESKTADRLVVDNLRTGERVEILPEKEVWDQLRNLIF